jgi:GGDEF domain-containing protein
MGIKNLQKVLRPAVTAAGIFSLIHAQQARKDLTSKMECILFQDPLTGGANERKFVQEAQRILCSADKKNYAVVAFHVKGFRIINEMFGYENGTKVLHGISLGIYKQYRSTRIERPCARGPLFAPFVFSESNRSIK